jgi:hypothetical protein
MFSSTTVAITMAMCMITMLMCIHTPSWVEIKRTSRK